MSFLIQGLLTQYTLSSFLGGRKRLVRICNLRGIFCSCTDQLLPNGCPNSDEFDVRKCNLVGSFNSLFILCQVITFVLDRLCLTCRDSVRHFGNLTFYFLQVLLEA